MRSNEKHGHFLLSSVILRYPPYISVQNFAPHRRTSPTSLTKKLCPILLHRNQGEAEAEAAVAIARAVAAPTERLNLTSYDFFRKKMRFRLDFLHLTVYYTQIRSPM